MAGNTLLSAIQQAVASNPGSVVNGLTPEDISYNKTIKLGDYKSTPYAYGVSDADAAKLGASLPAGYNWGNPVTFDAASNAAGPGGAKFGGGGGGANRYDYTAPGSGLWSIGIDPNTAGYGANLKSWYESQDPKAIAEIDNYYRTQPKTGDPVKDLATAVDARQRDVARQITKENGFLDTTLGKVVSALGPIALGAIPGIGPALAAASGAITGGLQDGALGAVLGGVGGYGGGQLGASLATNGIAGTVKNTVNSFKDFFGNGNGTTAKTAADLAGNSVPGIRTGITTPTGGGLVGAGQLNPAGVGILGNTAAKGISLGASPLAVAGGAAAADLFPNFPSLGQVQPLPSGQIPGTNTTVGPAPTNGSWSNLLKNLPSLNLSSSGTPVTITDTTPVGTGGAALPALAASGIGGGAGGAGGVPGNFFSEMSRILGDQAGIAAKTRPGAYFNALQALQPRYAAGYS